MVRRDAGVAKAIPMNVIMALNITENHEHDLPHLQLLLLWDKDILSLTTVGVNHDNNKYGHNKTPCVPIMKKVLVARGFVG